MEEKLIEMVYSTVAGYVTESCALPGVENAFAPGARCEELYNEMHDLLTSRFDPDNDEDERFLCAILGNMDAIQRELGFRMFRLGMRLALTAYKA